MAAIDRTSAPEQVFRSLAGDVLAGRYAPGDRLPPQRAIAAELGVNMATVREGIKRLEQLRLVEVRHGDAMRVLDWKTSGGLDVLELAADEHALAALFEARRLLLREAARLAAERRTPEQAEQLQALAGQLAAAESDEAAQGLDYAFMAVLVTAAGNLVFTLIMNSIREVYFSRLEEFRAIVSDRAELVPSYAEAAAAVMDRDGERAAQAIETLAAAQERRMRP